MTDQIKRLTDREQARQKISIFFGSRDNYYHPLKEMIANATDELRSVKQDNPLVEVILEDGQLGANTRLTIKDNGRGIPIGGKTDGVPNYELLFLTLFAGTKYDVTERSLTGTNGVGNTAITYTSTLFEVNSIYDSKLHNVKFINGGELSGKYVEKKLENNDDHGSSFTFELDPTVYTKTEFSPESIKSIVQHFAASSFGIDFVFKYKDEEFKFRYDNPKERFEEMIGNSSTSSIFTLGEILKTSLVQMVDRGDEVEESNTYNILFTSTPDVYQESYLNSTYLEQGGAINEGILDGIRLYMNKYCRDNKLFPSKVTSFTKDDVENSISFLAFCESNIVEFDNQTKLSTNKKKYYNEVKSYINDVLTLAQVNDTKNFKKLVDHLLTVQKANGVNERARKNLKKKLTEKVEGIGNKVEKLIDCEIHGKEAELFLTEGDSANGSIVDSRDDEFQAAFPLRGKVLNVLKAPLDRIFKNQEIINMVKIIGCGIQDGKKNDFDISKARFGKVVITTDADEDGAHIASLLIGFIYRFMRPLIEEGYIYVAQTPLYELKFSDDSVVYFRSENEKDREIKKYEGKKYVINRLKGLGEVDAETMHITTMNPETRTILKLTVEDVERMIKTIDGWLNNDVEYRKEVITDRLHEFVHDID